MQPVKKSTPTGQSQFTQEEAFRDSIGTLNESGKRRWIYPKATSGFFTRARRGLAVLLLLILFAGPWVQLNGHPLLLFNVLERKFVVLGQPFWPQDFFLFGLVFLAGVISIIVFTMVFGRIFCGWVCPQTIFMEFVFRAVERWIEGDAAAQAVLDKQPWTTEKIWKKSLKHAVFYGFSFLIGNTFLMYIIGKDAWLSIITDSPVHHLAGLFGMLAFSGVFYFVFSQVREQVCIVACPYGRLQGVLLDPNSIVISYDDKRGEPRGKAKKEDATPVGDCINCYQCVQVCPTGIDIRNGTQLECINCTACIDACDVIMDKLERPRGLIRYASQNQIARGEKFRVTPRIAIYSTVLIGLLCAIGFLVFTRSDVETNILRQPGSLYTQTPDGKVVNIYRYDVVNKTFDPKTLDFKLISPQNGNLKLQTGETRVTLKGQASDGGVLILTLEKNQLSGVKTPVVVEIMDNGKVVDKVKTSFLGPM